MIIRTLGIVLLLLAILAAQPALVSAVPGNPVFNFQCTSTGIVVWSGAEKVIQATFAEIAGPLAVAIATQQNQPIVLGQTISLWALKSDELQVHVNSNPDATKLIVKSDICGPIKLPSVAPTPVPTQQSQVVYVPVYVTTTTTTSGTVYVVKPGDNLYRISLKFGRSMSAIAAANGITNINLIFAGQRLIIP
jgi:LysM repeat protein